MLYLRKCCSFSSHVLMRQKFNIQKDVTSTFSVIHTSNQKSADSSQTDKSSGLVYEAPLKSRVKFVKYLSLTSSLIGFGIFPTVMMDLSKTSVLLTCAAGTISAFFLSTPFMLNWITKRYVIELHFDKETKTFTAKTLNLVNQIKEIKFQASDVTVPDLPGMLSSFSVNGKPLFVDASMIEDADAYSHMMGYDKPFDITITPDDQDKNTGS